MVRRVWRWLVRGYRKLRAGGLRLRVALRAEELHRDTVRQEILRNVRVLAEFVKRLDPKLAGRLEARLYRAAASMTLYRWDDRALIAFLSLGRHTSQGNQLEIDVDTSLGHFVEQHFSELWTEAVPLPDYLRLRVRLTDDAGGDGRDFELPYVELEGVCYFADPPLLAHLARAHAASGAVRATVAGAPDEQLQLQVVDEDAPNREALASHFREKYGWQGQVYLAAVPAAAAEQDTATEPARAVTLARRLRRSAGS